MGPCSVQVCAFIPEENAQTTPREITKKSGSFNLTAANFIFLRWRQSRKKYGRPAQTERGYRPRQKYSSDYGQDRRSRCGSAAPATDLKMSFLSTLESHPVRWHSRAPNHLREGRYHSNHHKLSSDYWRCRRWPCVRNE